MKKILFVIPSLEVGGTVSSLSSIIQFIKERYEISVFPLAYEGNLSVDFKDLLLPYNILVHAYNCNFANTRGIIRVVSFLLKILKRLTRFLNFDLETNLYRSLSTKFNDQYDVIVGFQEGCATKFASLLHAPSKIAWIHCDYTKYYGCGKELLVYEKFTKIVCVSKYTTDRFISVYPGMSDKSTFVYNLMNYDNILNNSKIVIDDARFMNDQFTILSVGRINSVKRFEEIPSIARFLVDQGCKFRWYIIGPNFGDDVYKSIFTAIVRESVEDYVFYLGNKINPYPYFSKSDLLVSLSSTEACPMIFNEAKVLGLPVVTTDFGSSYEFINDGVDGYIVPIEKLGSKLYELINITDMYNLIQRGIRNVMPSNKVVDDKLLEIFE